MTFGEKISFLILVKFTYCSIAFGISSLATIKTISSSSSVCDCSNSFLILIASLLESQAKINAFDNFACSTSCLLLKYSCAGTPFECLASFTTYKNLSPRISSMYLIKFIEMSLISASTQINCFAFKKISSITNSIISTRISPIVGEESIYSTSELNSSRNTTLSPISPSAQLSSFIIESRHVI